MHARCTLLFTFVLVSQALVCEALAQEKVDYTALAEPAFANRLALTDEQRSAVAKQLDERVQKLVAAKPGERSQVLAESNEKLEQLLSDEQKATFATLVAGGKLRFNFRQQKWPDVLDWFARQSDLALVMDTSPPGLFTYTDTKEYTPREAIDLLNSVLLSKGFTLMRREKMMIVVDTTEGIPFEMAPRVTVEELADRGRFEIATVEFALGGRPIDTCIAMVKELIGKHGRVTPLTSAGKLIVTETSGKLLAINEVIAAIPIPKAPPAPGAKPKPVFMAYPAKGLDPQVTVDTLQGLFTTATIKADPTAEEIHVNAPPAIHVGIKASLEKMTASVSGDKRTRLEIYEVDIKDFSQLQSQLVLAVPKAQVTADEAQQRLLVVANAEQHAEVEQTLQKLGAVGKETVSKETVTVYQVENEATAGLVTLLQQILPRGLIISQPGRIAVRATPDEQELAQTTIEQFQQTRQKPELPSLKFYPLSQPLDSTLLSAIMTTVPDAALTLLDDGKRLSVLASAEDHSLIVATLEQIETELPQPAKRTLEIYHPEQVVASEMQTLLGSVVPDARINVGPSGKRLIVWATQTEHENISATLQKVGDASPPDEKTLETYKVSEAAAAAILTAVQALVPTAQSSLDSTNHRLIVIGAAADQQLIGELVEKLAPVGDQPLRVLIAYPLAKGDAAAIVEMLQELRPDVRFAADKRANRILVTAPLREQPRLQAVIEQLDAAPDVGQEEIVKPYRLNTLNPATVVELLQPIYPKMRLSVSPESKQLLAVGTEFDHQKLKKTVARISGEKAMAAQVQSYEIGTADSEQVRNVLLQLVPEAVVSMNPAARRLMVWADEAGHGAIKQALDQFTRQEPDQTRQLRTYPLPQEIGSAVLTMLQPVAPDAMLSLDESGKQIIAWATGPQQKAVQDAIEELMQNLPQRAAVSLRVHQATADVLRIANPLLTDVAPKARLVESADADKWLVWATAAEHQAVAELLQTLTEQVETKKVARSLKAYPLARTDTGLVRQMIADQAEEATILDSSDAQRLIVLGTTDEHTKIEAVLAELATVLEQPDTSLRVYPIEDRRLAAQTIVDSLDAVVTAGLSVQVNVDANSLIVRASEASHQRLQQAITALVEQLPPAPSLNTQVFRFSQGSPSVALPMLQSLVPAASIAANDAAGTLAATASEVDLAQIKTVVEQMQATEPKANFVTQIYRFHKVNAETARSTFLQLVPDASIAFDADANIVIASAPEMAHEVFRETTAQLEGPQMGSVVRVYPLDANQITAAEVAAAMDDALKKSVALLVNETVNCLIVRGSEESQKEIRLVIDAIVEQLPAALAKTTKVYPLKLASAVAVQNAITSLIENGSVTGDEASSSLLVTGTDADHKRVAAVIEKLDVVPSRLPVMRAYPIRHSDAKAIYQTVSQAFASSSDVSVTFQPSTRSLFVVATLQHQAIFKELIAELDQPGPPRQPQYAKVYSLANVDGNVAASALNKLFQGLGVEISFNPTGNALVVIATTDQHKLVEESLTQLEGPQMGSVVRVYPLDANQITAAEVAAAMDDALKKSVALLVNETVNCLIVRGSEESQKEIRLVIDAIVEQLPAALAKTTKVYPLKLASAVAVQNAITSLIENGSVTGDEASSSLLVTGTDADHKRVAAVIEKLDVVPSRLPVMRAYPIRHSDAKAIYQTVSQAFASSSDVSVTFQPSTRSLFVVATLQHQAIFKELIAELDQPGPPRQPQYAKVYSLANVDGNVAASALNKLFQGLGVEISFNPTGNALVVIATTDQHKLVEESLTQMEGIERTLEVFVLQNTDPFVVENAVYELFVDAPDGAAPSVSSDYDSQRLFVRGTKPQIEQIRKLLVSLGEPVEDTRDVRQTGDVRTIPFRGDTREAIRQIQSIWDRLRPNRIQVITPSQRHLIPQQLRTIPEKPSGQEGSSADREDDRADKSSAVHVPPRFHFVVMQQTTRKEAPDQADADKRPAKEDRSEQNPNASSKVEPDSPPIVVVPEEGRITIASPDHEALDQLESLLRAMARSNTGTNAHPNFAIYLLRNTGADEMQELLKELFDELPISRSSMGKVVVVADERMNALIVHGSRKDREIVEELLRVLDTSELPDPLSVARPELIGIKNTQAQRVLAILENVYKTQLTSGGGRKPVPIPEGVSSDVASVLQQINAASAGPLLTLDVDETSNSIVMRAPPELRKEIKAFVEQLDGQASDRSNRGIRVIRLQNSKAERMQAVLQQFILQGK